MSLPIIVRADNKGLFKKNAENENVFFQLLYLSIFLMISVISCRSKGKHAVFSMLIS